jgi:4-hydroxybenzoate polyprenyltransferase
MTLATSGRASFKEAVAASALLAPELLPYNDDVIAYLEDVRRKGRRIVLVTAANERVARAVADHLGIFDDVIASNGSRNLKGEAKARELEQRFGRGGFEYIGNDSADLAVWRTAAGIGIVNASSNVARRARALGPVTLEVSNRAGLLAAALRAMRPHQWTKNLLVFVPLLASRSLTDVGGWLAALVVFAAFCATASAIYLVNDLLDLASDRRHPRKRSRPLASGALPLATGAGLAVVLLLLGIALSASVGALALVALYAAISLAYSLSLKQFPLLDVFILAALYTLRVVVGGVVSGHPVTLWLLAFSGFTFLGLAMVKRVAELQAVSRKGLELANSRRGYRLEDRPMLEMAGIASAFASSVVLALYMSSNTAFEQYRSPQILWGLVPLVLFWQLRLWLSTYRSNMHDDPIVFAMRDWVSWIVAASFLVVMIAASLL